MRRTTLTAFLTALAAAVGLAQQPTPPQPLPPGVVPVGAASPAPATEAPITKYDPLAAFPTPTQQAVRGVALGAGWLVRMNQAQGRFVYGYRPAVRQPMDGDDHLGQAYGALALAQAAKFTGDDRSAAVARQAVLMLLSTTRIDPTDPASRAPVPQLGCNHVGFAALLALAVYDLPAADDTLLAEAERLCAFVRKACAADGSVAVGGARVEGGPVSESAGLALQALAAGNRVRPDPAKAEAVAKGVAYYRAAFGKAPDAAGAAALAPAFAELHLQTRNPDAAAAVYELADWLCSAQHPVASPRHPAWAGGFRGTNHAQPAAEEPGCASGSCLAGLGWAYLVTARNADVARAERYRQAAQDAALFVTSLQYSEANTRHFENTFRANVLIGGFHLSPSDGDLRVDATGRCVSGLLRYLASGAER